MKHYPADFRDRLLRALDAGLARAEATRTFGVPERTIRRWQQRCREIGSVAPLRRQRVIGAEAEAPLRAAAARTFERLVTAIGHALLTVLAVDARGCFAHCGYAPPGHLL